MDSANGSNVKCLICLGSSLAVFAAECGHSFHLNCIATDLRQQKICPICSRKWNTPLQITNPSPINSTPNFIPSYYHEPQFFSDDDSLPPMNTPNSHPQQITLKSHTEYPALPASEFSSTFTALIRIIAPSTSPDFQHRSPIDLVLVLDVSSSMSGQKLSLLKQAVTFVIENLGTRDRLSIVTFSNTAHRVYPLRRMSSVNQVKENAIKVVNSLTVMTNTDILAGLRKGVRVLHERREKNPVASLMLLSDGEDNAAANYGGNRTASIISAGAAAVGAGIPVHTFGFGVHHDSTLLHGLANATEGTYSFIESIEMINEALARCIGGLLSVVAKDLMMRMWVVSNGVRIARIPATETQVKCSGTEGVINVGMLYADEEKQFLVYLYVPRVELEVNPSRKEEMMTMLLDLSCEYKEPNQEFFTIVEGETVKITRPRVLSHLLLADPMVVKEKNRVEMVEDIGRAQSMADSEDLPGARSLLEQRVKLLRAAAAAGDDPNYYGSLEGEIVEIKRRMENMEIYRQMGKAYILSSLNAHGLQRATTRGNVSSDGGYDTPGITAMVNKCKVEKVDDGYDTLAPPVISPMLKKVKVEKVEVKVEKVDV